MIEILCSKSSITADTASRKDLTLQGCTKVSTGTSTLFARSVNIHPSVCRRGLSHDVPRHKASTWGPPHRVDTRNGVGRSPRRSQGLGRRLCTTANPQTGTVGTAESCPDPKQYTCYLSHNLNKAVSMA